MLEQGLLVMYLALHDDSIASRVKRLLVISNAATSTHYTYKLLM